MKPHLKRADMKDRRLSIIVYLTLYRKPVWIKAVEDFNKLIKTGSANTEIYIKNKKGEDILVHMDAVKLTDTEYMSFWKEVNREQ